MLQKWQVLAPIVCIYPLPERWHPTPDKMSCQGGALSTSGWRGVNKKEARVYCTSEGYFLLDKAT
jgi:hypothetical protein